MKRWRDDRGNGLLIQSEEIESEHFNILNDHRLETILTQTRGAWLRRYFRSNGWWIAAAFVSIGLMLGLFGGLITGWLLTEAEPIHRWLWPLYFLGLALFPTVAVFNHTQFIQTHPNRFMGYFVEGDLLSVELDEVLNGRPESITIIKYRFSDPKRGEKAWHTFGPAGFEPDWEKPVLIFVWGDTHTLI